MKKLTANLQRMVMEAIRNILEVIGLVAVGVIVFLYLRSLAKKWFPRRDHRLKDWEDRHGY